MNMNDFIKTGIIFLKNKEYHVQKSTIHNVNKNHVMSGNVPNKKYVRSTWRKLYNFTEGHKRR